MLVIFKNRYPSLRCAHSKAGPRPADVDMEPFHGRLAAYDTCTLVPSLDWMSRRLRQRRRRRAELPAPNRSPPLRPVCTAVTSSGLCLAHVNSISARFRTRRVRASWDDAVLHQVHGQLRIRSVNLGRSKKDGDLAQTDLWDVVSSCKTLSWVRPIECSGWCLNK